MAKPDKPLFSLGARGTIGEALTFQKRGQGTIAREKPIPKDPYSLNQAYQRWDYRDYAYLWTLLTNSEKQVYRTKASRYHITGFSQYMRENLKALTDIAARWRLDETGGALAYDTSRNSNTATIIGASPATGLIAGGYYLDGLNDIIRVPVSPSLSYFTATTLEFFAKLPSLPPHHSEIYYGGYVNAPFGDHIWLINGTDTLRVWLKNTLGITANRDHTIPIDDWFHFAYTWDGVNVRYYLNGDLVGAPNPFTGTLACAPVFQSIGYYTPFGYTEMYADHFVRHRRALDITELKRHSERRYPL